MQEINRYTSILIAILAIAILATGCSQEVIGAYTPQKFALSKLQADYKQFRKKIESSSPMYFVDKEELANLFDTQYQLLEEGMGELEFVRVLSPIVAALRCGHSHVFVSEDYSAYIRENSAYLPFSTMIIGGRLYIVDDYNIANIPAGSEVIAIDGQPVEEVVGVMFNSLSADGYNETKKEYIINHWFNALYYHYIDNPASFVVEYVSPQEKTANTAVVEAIPDKSMGITTMLPYTQNWDSQYSKQVYEDYAILTIKLFSRLDSAQKYKAFLKDFFQELTEKNITNLVLDLRGNWGGTPGPAVELFSYLIDQPTSFLDKSAHPLLFMYKRATKPRPERFTGNLYTLIDGASFSITGHLIAQLRHHNIGTLIGEESGGGYLCTDASRATILKNTGVTLYCSTRVFRAATPGMVEGRGVIPDYEVMVTLNHYLDKTDPVMAKALELIER